MVIIIKQNGKTVSLDSLNDQYNKFVRDKSRQFGLLLDTVGAFIEPWVWSDSYSNEKCLSLLKRLSIKNPQSIPARDAVYCLMAVVALVESDTAERQESIRFIKPVADFLNSLDNTTFCIKF